MIYIKLDEDMKLIMTVREPLYRGDNLNRELIYLIPLTAGDIDMSTARLYLSYIRSDGTADMAILDCMEEKYNENYYQYTLPITCDLTRCSGEVCTWLQIYTGDPSDPIISKSGECILYVQESKNTDDYLSDQQLTAIYQLQTTMENEVAEIDEDIENLKENSVTAESVNIKIAKAVATIMKNPDEIMNSINELVDWCNNHAEDTIKLMERVSATEGDIDVLEDLMGTTATFAQISNAIEEALIIDGVDKYALATELTAAIVRIAANELEIIALKDLVDVSAIDAQIADAIASAFKIDGVDKYALAAELAGAIARIATNEQDIINLESLVSTTDNAINALNAGPETSGSVDYKIAQAIAAIIENPDDTMNSINELVTWCNNHAADALELNNKVFVNEQAIDALGDLVGSTAVATQITDAIAAALTIEGADKYALAANLAAAFARIVKLETDIVKKANDAELSDIAKSGNVNDLIQTDGDYIIFNCGSSSSVI